VRWRWWKRPEVAHEAIAAAQERLDAANAAEAEVSRVVRELRRIQNDNNFGARLAAAFRDHR
jgi:hypothetical protein